MDAFASDFIRRAEADADAEPAPRQEAPAPAAPLPHRPADFRSVLGRFATGVTVVTCDGELGPLGMTVNSFTSLSLDPPLVMWAPAKTSRRTPSFTSAERFAVHVLGAEQRALADAFMRSGDAFDATRWHAAPDGLPLIAGCLARIECRRDAIHEAGDHLVLVGRVERLTSRDGDPLLYYAGRYQTLG